jgi:hypothetical protein
MRNAYNHLQLAPMYSYTVKLSKHWQIFPEPTQSTSLHRLIASGIVDCDQMAATLKGLPNNLTFQCTVCNRLGKSNLRVLDNIFGSLKFHSVFVVLHSETTLGVHLRGLNLKFKRFLLNPLRKTINEFALTKNFSNGLFSSTPNSWTHIQCVQ